MELLLEGKLNEYLHEIDEECYEMLWVGKMNNIIACAEEVVVREVVYV